MTYPMLQFEKKIHSQCGEDGIIQHIFEKIGTTNKVAAEIGVAPCSAVQYENNTYNLILNGWKAFWFDCIDTPTPANCIFTKKILTADNVLDTFESVGVPKDIDLLSIDVDGNDYHLRESLALYNPRVCIMEYNGTIDALTEYVMVRNDDYMWKYPAKDYGASLLSLTKQADKFGYDLIYCDENGVNAYFVRKDLNCFGVAKPEDTWKRVVWDRSI